MYSNVLPLKTLSKCRVAPPPFYHAMGVIPSTQPHFLLLHCGFSYKWRKILGMLLKLINLCELIGVPLYHAMGVIPSTQLVATFGSSFILSSFDLACTCCVPYVRLLFLVLVVMLAVLIVMMLGARARGRPLHHALSCDHHHQLLHTRTHIWKLPRLHMSSRAMCVSTGLQRVAALSRNRSTPWRCGRDSNAQLKVSLHVGYAMPYTSVACGITGM